MSAISTLGPALFLIKRKKQEKEELWKERP
jgi:hypothetical protein